MPLLQIHTGHVPGWHVPVYDLNLSKLRRLGLSYLYCWFLATLKYENYYHPSEFNDLTLEENVQSKFLSLGRNQKQRPVVVSKPSPEEGRYFIHI